MFGERFVKVFSQNYILYVLLFKVMPEFVLAHALGVLVSHLLTVVTGIMLAKEDITASDALLVVGILTRLLQQLKRILSVRIFKLNFCICSITYLY